MKLRDMKFAPVKSWLGGNMTEKVEGWKCTVYEAAGKVSRHMHTDSQGVGDGCAAAAGTMLPTLQASDHPRGFWWSKGLQTVQRALWQAQ